MDKVEKAVLELDGSWPDAEPWLAGRFPPGRYYSTVGSGGNSLRVQCDELGGTERVCTHSEFMEARKRLENKPDWNSFAIYIAQDADGYWWEFDKEPKLGVRQWFSQGGKYRMRDPGKVFGDWRQSLERRPVSHPMSSEQPGSGEGVKVENWHHVNGRSIPPVGEVVEFCVNPIDPKSVWSVGEIAGFHSEWVWIIFNGLPNSWSISKVAFRPIKSHKERVIEAVYSQLPATPAHTKRVLGMAYDLGLLRLPEDKEGE